MVNKQIRGFTIDEYFDIEKNLKNFNNHVDLTNE